MIYANRWYVPIPEVKALFGCMANDASNPFANPFIAQMDMLLEYSNNVNFKCLHPLFFKGYRMPSIRFGTKPLHYVGLDFETNVTNGKPMLMGLWYPQEQVYDAVYQPVLEKLFEVVQAITENYGRTHLITWGQFDMQCILRLFSPTESERECISRGLSANVKNGQIVGSPPISRMINDIPFYVAHYIPGRSLKLAYLQAEREHSIWVFNCSQFYPETIATTAKGLGLPWYAYGKETHIVNWTMYDGNVKYRMLVHASNRQDAQTVVSLADVIQARFHDVFECYPTLLVSTGSLTDAATSKLLADDKDSYASNSWQWLCYHVFQQNSPAETIAMANTLLAEAFSAGYIDQYAIGYFPDCQTADISAAYPYQIRQLPDLRYASLSYGRGRLDLDVAGLVASGRLVETAIIRGCVHIPDTLRFHPITTKTYNRENCRPIGDFYATYLLEERNFCSAHGASFTDEEYVIVHLSEKRLSPIAGVSELLGQYRNTQLAKLKIARNSDERKVLDGQQYLTKIIDNSIYGKTVMTTEVVEDVKGRPIVVGYNAGDRFNLLYGCMITARTRIRMANTCLTIQRAGGQPVLVMTDSVYWYGRPECLPESMIRRVKTPGYFDSPTTVHHMYVLKTGQYEYEHDGIWTHKVRGLNLDWDVLHSDTSFYRTLIRKHCLPLKAFFNPRDIHIPIPTKRLVTIGSRDLERLGLIEEGITKLTPFVLSGKQGRQNVHNWKGCLDGHEWLDSVKLQLDGDTVAAIPPLALLHNLYIEKAKEDDTLRESNAAISHKVRADRLLLRKQEYLLKAIRLTHQTPPDGVSTRMPWSVLEAHFGLTKEVLLNDITHD